MKSKLSELVRKFVTKKTTRPLRGKNKKFSPSGFGKCYRRQYWARMEVPPTNGVSDEVSEMAEMGNLCEFIYSLTCQGFETQVLIADGHFKGYADFEFEDVIEEAKSVTGSAFSQIKKDDFDLVGEKLSNGLQVSWYANQRGKPGVLVYISRDSLKIERAYIKGKELRFVFKEELKVCKKDITKEWEELLDIELETLVNYWDKQELPPPRQRFMGECSSQCCYLDKCVNYRGGENGREDISNRRKWSW